jgi:glycerol-3-phosphate dehydrogenase
MRPRDPAALADHVHDILVIGGGVYGLAIAGDAASRGLSVALVEAADFGSATSFNHQKTVHGGLRALQKLRIDRARESIHERRALALIAPRLLRTLPFIIGTYRSVLANRLAIRAAFRIDKWLGRRRNNGVEPELRLPDPRLESRAATLKLFPGIRAEALTGGAMWYDYQMVEAERLTVAFAEAADALGARLANYVEAVDALREDRTITGMRVRDRLTDTTYDVRALMTINAAGHRVGDVMRRFGIQRDVPLLLALNVVTSKPASDIALAAPGRDGRMLTLVPWRGKALIGTGQSDEFRQPADTATVSRAEIESFVTNANVAFPALHLTLDAIRLVHRGLVPAARGRNGRAELLGAPQIFDHADEGVRGALTVVGVKYTTARGVAARVVSHAAKRLDKRVPPSQTERRILPGAGIADHEALAIETARAVGLELAPPITRHLTGVYGDRCVPVIKLMAERTDWRMPLVAGHPQVGAEVIYTIREEMACTLADIVIRRTQIGSGGHPGAAIIGAMAAVAAEELGWDTDRREREIAAVDSFYVW